MTSTPAHRSHWPPTCRRHRPARWPGSCRDWPAATRWPDWWFPCPAARPCVRPGRSGGVAFTADGMLVMLSTILTMFESVAATSGPSSTRTAVKSAPRLTPVSWSWPPLTMSRNRPVPSAAVASRSELENRIGVSIGNSVGDASAEVSIARILEKSAPITGTGSSAGRENCMPKTGAGHKGLLLREWRVSRRAGSACPRPCRGNKKPGQGPGLRSLDFCGL